MPKFVRRLCLRAILLLICSGAQAAPPSCALSAPASATAGAFFPIEWSFSGGTSAQIRRDDGTVIGKMTAANGKLRAWATSVLGSHGFTMMVVNARGHTRQCAATVDFTYERATVTGYDIVIVAGQSNASGKGVGTFDALRQKLLADDIVQIGRLGDSNMQLVPVGYWQNGTLFDGLQFWDRDEGDTEMGFTLSLAQNYVANGELAAGRKLLIVPAAEGGTSILDWLDPSAGSLYSDMVARARFALALPGDNRIVAFLWQQGENDVLKIENGDPDMSVDIYRTDLAQLFADVRNDFAAEPPYPILAGLMVPHWLSDDSAGFAIKTSIDNDIKQVTRSGTAMNFVNSKGLTSNLQIGFSKGGDEHFNAQSQLTLGNRYFKAWLAQME